MCDRAMYLLFRVLAFASVLCASSQAWASGFSHCLLDVEVGCDGPCNPSRFDATVRSATLEQSSSPGYTCPAVGSKALITQDRPLLAAKDGARLMFVRQYTSGSIDHESTHWKYRGPSTTKPTGCGTAGSQPLSLVICLITLAWMSRVAIR